MREMPGERRLGRRTSCGGCEWFRLVDGADSAMVNSRGYVRCVAADGIECLVWQLAKCIFISLFIPDRR